MSIRPNRVKQRLAAGQVATILAGTNDPDLIDQLGPLGADGIWLEGEHGGVDYADLGNLTRACDLWSMTSVVRVMDNDYATIYRTLDRGAHGIVVPHVNTRAEAEAVVEAGKFAPLGKRGMFTSRQGFGVGDYLKTANDQSLLIVLLEDIVAVKNLDDILEVDHIDVFFVAPGDLATSMGHIGEMGHPEVQQTIDGAIKRIVQAGRTAGTLVNAGNVERYTRMGVRAIMASFFYIYPDVGASFALIAYVTVALGGFGSVFGAFAGGILVGLVEATTALVLPPSLKSVGIYAVYLLVVFIRPRGLFGQM